MVSSGARPRPIVLVVDADTEARRSVVNALDQAGFASAEAVSYSDAVDRLEGFAYDGLITDVRIPGGDGLDLLDVALNRYPRMKCIVTASFGSLHHAVRALKRGASDYLIKPVGAAQLEEPFKMLGKETAAPIVTAAPAVHVAPTFDGIVGSSPAMATLFDTLGRVAPMQSAVLVNGETGTGKELVARTIHNNSPRRDHGFVAFNAAAIPEGLAEAELFGHIKGAFTGAVYTRVGRFEAADRGTLFIDEVSSMSLPLQAKLLRAIQEKEIERIGTSRPMPVNVRIIAASNLDLATMVKEGRFREDLYYRLNVVRVSLPALRERIEDIPELAQHFVEASCKLNDLPMKVLAQSTLQMLMTCAWPGNVRQLQNCIESAVVMSGADQEIQPGALPIEIQQPEPVKVETARPGPSLVETPDTGINFASAMSALERDLIFTYLRKANGNKRQAARLLQLSRTTLIDKLHRLGFQDESQAEQQTETAAVA